MSASPPNRAEFLSACRQLGLKRSRLYDLIKAYKARPITGSLLTVAAGTQTGSRRLPEAIEAVIAEAIEGFYQVPSKAEHQCAAQRGAYPAGDRMPCLLIYGDTGMGKTKIIRKFERDLYRELLASMDAPAIAGGTLAREKDVCRSLLRTVGAKMIILDEVNGMLAGTFRQQRIFLNAIRFLANDLRIPLVCAGTDLARQALLTDAHISFDRDRSGGSRSFWPGKA